MIDLNNRADIATNKLNRVFKHNNAPVLKLDIEYPVVLLPHGSGVQTRINLHYKNYARNFYRYAELTMLPAAIEQYEAAKKDGNPFNVYEAVMTYCVTLNGDCRMSAFADKYEYTGGAHGSTTRSSNTWDLQNGNHVKMVNLFGTDTRYRKTVIRKIQAEAEKSAAENPDIYFDNYRQLIEDNFNSQSFFLTPKNLNVYYQQYDIAPYSTGIVVFELPYESLGIERPRCMQEC